MLTEHARLKDHVAGMDGQLDAIIAEGGLYYSAIVVHAWFFILIWEIQAQTSAKDNDNWFPSPGH